MRPTDQLYRTARVVHIHESEIHPGDMGLLRDSIRDRLGEILRRMTTAGEKPPPLERLDDLDDARFVNVLAQALDFGVLEKQRLLEAPGSLDRAAILDDLLDFRLAEIDARSASGSDRMH